MKTRIFAVALASALSVSGQPICAQQNRSLLEYAGAELEVGGAQPAIWEESQLYHPSGGNVPYVLSNGQAAAGNSTCEECCDYGCDSCDSGCDSGCDDCCAGGCCPPTWQFFGDYLYLRPRNAEVAYGVPFNGPVNSPPAVPIQIGRAGVVDHDYDSGFRTGFSRMLSDCASLGVTYTFFESSNSNQISIDAPYVIRSMVSHPSTWSASSDGLDANASVGIDFDLVDLDFRNVLLCGQLHSINYLLGVRYAYLEQGFRSQYAVNGLETVLSNIRFDGGGFRLGLEGERRLGNSCFKIYGRSVASFVAGKFRADYAQGQAFDRSVVDTGWSAGRIVPVLDLELGVDWTSCNGCWRIAAGYMLSAWYNTVKTDDFIEAVRTNNFIDLGDTLTFDGLAARIEWRY